MAEPTGRRSRGWGKVYDYKNQEYVSVTTALSALAKPALVPWASGLVATAAVEGYAELLDMIEREGNEAAIAWLKRKPNDTKEKAANIGKTIHAAVEAHVLGAPEGQWPLDYRGHQEQWQRFLAEKKPVFEMAEATVYERTFMYAGTLDFIATIPGYGRVIGDTKSGKNVYDEVGLQLAAYRYADFIAMPDDTEAPMPELDGAVVLHLRPDDYKLLSFDASLADHQVFLHLLEVWRWNDARDQEYRARSKK